MSTANNIEPTEIKKLEGGESPTSQHVAKIPAPPNDRPSLYVGDVDPSVNEEDLFELFSRTGMLASCKLNRDKKNPEAPGYAYIDYHTLDDARKALLENNFKKVKGREIRVMWCQPDSAIRRSGKGNVFVKNLDESIDNRTLLDTFSLFGTVLSSKIACGPDGKSLGYGFVHFNTIEEAQKAIKKADRMHLVSKSIKVCEFLPRASRDRKDTKFTNIYVKNFSPEQFPDENAFKKYFETFGEVTSVHFPLDETNNPRLFGFVNYSSTEVARKVVEDFASNEKETLYVVQALSKAQRKMQLADNNQRWRREIDERTAGRNVYIKNLPEDITGQRLAEHFSQFGGVEQAKVATGDNNRSKGFGFVLFSDRDSAANAIRNLNGSEWLMKRLYVGLFQRKEVRRAQSRAMENNRRRLLPTHPQGMQMHPMVGGPGYFSQPPFMIQQPMMYPPNQMYPMSQPQVLNPTGQPSQAQIQQQMAQVQPSQVYQAQQLMDDLNQQNTIMSKQEMDMRRQGHREAPRQTTGTTNVPEMMIPQEEGANLIDFVYAQAHKIDSENAGKITGMIAELEPNQIMDLMADNMAGLYNQLQRASQMIREAKRKEDEEHSMQA